MIYLATIEEDCNLVLNDKETGVVKEFLLEEILDENFDTNSNQRE